MEALPLIPTEAVAAAIARHLPGRAIHTIEDRGVWVRHSFKITLEDGASVWVKVHVHAGWSDGSEKEAFISRLLLSHGLPAARVLAVDTSCELIAQPYLIQEHVSGTRLSVLLEQVDKDQAAAIYRSLGACYRRLHAIHAERSGWIEGPGRVYDISPNDHMHRAAIVEAGGRAVDQGLLAAAVHRRMMRVAERHLNYSKDHTPALIHGNAFPWAVSLEPGPAWRVTRLMDLGDALYWDPAYDLAGLKYPPFGQEHPLRWQAFLDGYGPPPAERRLLLYLLIQRLQAAMGDYLEPPGPGNQAWRARALLELPQILDRIENVAA
jgi:Ser/Thr protein kinase RdoA (MazF antagonist)